MIKLHNKYTINGIETREENYNIYKFLTKDDKNLEKLFHMMLDEYGIIGRTIVRFKAFIRENMNINFDEITRACSNKNIIDCKDILEELFLEQIDIEEVATKMDRQGWNLESLILEHKRHPEMRIHRILNIPYSTYIINYSK